MKPGDKVWFFDNLNQEIVTGVVDKVEGKLYKKATVSEVTRLIKRLVNQYL